MSKTVTLESKIKHFRDLLYDAWEIGAFRYGVPDFRVIKKLEQHLKTGHGTDLN